MTKTSAKQLILLIFAAILIVLVYLIYPSQKKQFSEKESIVLEDENVENTFRDILYNGITENGNPFEIGSEYAEIRKEQCALPLEQYNYQYEWGLWLTTCKLRKIRDELIPEEKSI